MIVLYNLIQSNSKHVEITFFGDLSHIGCSHLEVAKALPQPVAELSLHGSGASGLSDGSQVLQRLFFPLVLSHLSRKRRISMNKMMDKV